MSWIHDEDVRHYLKIIGAVVFFCILVLCVLLFVFKPEGKIELKSNTVEYGDKVTSIDLIKKVKGKDIADARHTKGSLSFPDLEITADELDTFELGKHSITYSFSDGSEDIVEVIEVKDTVKPEIKLKSKKIELSLAEAKKMTSWKKYYEISDNYPEAPTSTEKLDKEEFDYGDTVHLDIIAADASGNKSKAQLTIDIKEKEKPKEKKDDKKDTEKESSSTNKDSTYGPDQAKEDDKKHSQSEGYPNDQPNTENRPKPAGKDYLFSDGFIHK